MAEHLQQNADEISISFNLSIVFNSDDVDFQEISNNDIPDGVLCELMDSVNEMYPSTSTNTLVENQHCQDPENQKSACRFPTLSTKDIENIASNTVKTKLIKQST